MIIQASLIAGVLVYYKHYVAGALFLHPSAIIYPLFGTILNCLWLQYFGLHKKTNMILVRIYAFAGFSIVGTAAIFGQVINATVLLSIVLLLVGVLSMLPSLNRDTV